MTAEAQHRPQWRTIVVRAGLLLAVYSLAATFALTEFLRWPGVNSARPDVFGRDFFGDMMHGRASRPYSGRALVPWLVAGIERLAPERLKARVAADTRMRMVSDGTPEWLDRHPFEYAVVRLLLLLSLLGFAFALRSLARWTLGLSGIALDALPLAGLVALPGMYGYMSHVFDFPTLLLFTLGLALVAARRSAGYAAVFVLACVNKETAILLTLVWVLQARRRTSRSTVITGAGWQLLAWLVIRGGISLLYRGNPGSEIELHLFRNLAVLARPANYFHFRAVGDWLVYPVGWNVLTIGLFAWALVALVWRPGLLRDAFWLAATMLILSMLFGNIDELRVYYEVYPVLITAFVGSLYRFAGYLPDSSTPVPAS